MRLSFNILFLGWWLSGQKQVSGDERYSKPSMSVHPSNMVALGGNVSIRCKSEDHKHMEFYLHTKMYDQDISGKTTAAKAELYEAIFSILNAKITDVGIYWCVYHTTDDRERWSFESDTVCIQIIDPSLSKASIKVRPGEQLGLGMNVTIECQGQDEHLNVSLYKSKKWIASLLTEPSKNTVEFHFFGLRLEDQGSYTCQYHHKDNLFVWSEPSDPVQIIVREAHTTEDFVTIIWASLAVGLLLVLLLLLLAFILYRKRKKGRDSGKLTVLQEEDKQWRRQWRQPQQQQVPLPPPGSTANERTQPLPLKETSMFLEAEAGEDPDGVSYAVLNHHPLKSKQPANPDIVPESCVYASVINSRTSEG